MARIVPSTDDLSAEAARRLRAGDVVAFPTETVYGLGADTFNPAALEKVFQLKGRPFDNPLIAHVLDWEQVQSLMEATAQAASRSAWPSLAPSLASIFWPGPLSLVLPKSDRVPARATAGRPTTAGRSPAHPVARELLQVFGGPISAPSANRSGHVSPTSAQHVFDDYSCIEKVEELLILDGGPCEVGIESTVLDLTSAVPRVLRPGAVTLDQLRAVIGEVEAPYITQQVESPGTSASHYAPHTPAELVTADELKDRLAHATKGDQLVALTFDPSLVKPPHVAIAMPSTPVEYARVLYSALRQADRLNCQRILIEQPPREGDAWQAIHDRLARATHRRA
jgi:L-threonylcarbamoyladenylate synthase